VPIEVNKNFLPLYVVTHRGTVTEEEFEAYLRDVTLNMYQPQSEKRILIQDATESAPTSAKIRRRQADWLREHENRLKFLTIATVFVIPSGFVRGVLTAILWLQPLPMPHHVCSTLAEALEWAEQRLREEGLAAPPHARELLLIRSGHGTDASSPSRH